MKIVFLFLALMLATVSGGLLLRDDEAEEATDALPPHHHAMDAFEDDEDEVDEDEDEADEDEDEEDEDEDEDEDEEDEEDEDEADDALPTFEDEECPPDLGLDLCVKVVFPNGMEDMLLLAKDSPNSTVYDGFLAGEEDVDVVLIDAPEDDERIISFESDNSLHCDMFDVDMKTGEVSCTTDDDEEDREITAGDDEVFAKEVSDRGSDFTKANTNGKIVPLGKYYKAGFIPLSVLFTFDTDFVKTFGTTGMSNLIALVKKEFVGKSLKKLVGTTIKVTGTIRKFSRALKDKGSNTAHTSSRCQQNQGDWPCTFQTDAGKQKAYDQYTYIGGLPSDGGGGVAMGATICKSDKGERISFSRAPTTKDCKNDKIKKCTKSYRLGVLAKTTAHEIGHNLGMAHDFNQSVYQKTKKFQYRKYGKKSCKGGLMDYGLKRNGWSACSARDFSRYITKAGTTKPCTIAKGWTTTTSSGGTSTSTGTSTGTSTTSTTSTTSCSASCAQVFAGCHNHFKTNYGMTCSRAYTVCRNDILDEGRWARDGCKKKCKDTKAMTALKSCKKTTG